MKNNKNHLEVLSRFFYPSKQFTEAIDSIRREILKQGIKRIQPRLMQESNS